MLLKNVIDANEWVKQSCATGSSSNPSLRIFNGVKLVQPLCIPLWKFEECDKSYKDM